MRLPKFPVFITGIVFLSSQLVFVGVQPATAVNDVSSTCAIGSSSSCPAQSPQEIINLYGTNTNGSYWLNVNGTATQTYLLLDTNYPDGGGWFLGMKGTRAGNAFIYASNYWTNQSTTLLPDYNNNVATEAKYNAFNHLPVTQIVAVFKDRSSYNFSNSGTGVLGPSSFGGHTWQETITSQSMYTRFTTGGDLGKGTGALPRHDYYRESNSPSANLVFAYQSGYYKYGFAYENTAPTNPNNNAAYRWGAAFNNEQVEGSLDSSDSQMGIGLRSYSAASVYTYVDQWGNAINGGTGQNGSGRSQSDAATYPSGFQIWGKMAAGTLAAPTSLAQSQQSSSSTRVSWGAVASATEYLVQYKTSAQSWSQGSTVRVTNSSASPSATLTGLTDSSYNLRIWARGTGNLYASANGSLTLSLDQTAPTITGPSSATGATSAKSIAENSTAVHTFTANESVTWSKSGTDGSFFSIASNGDLTITARDFESPADSGTNNTYEVVVTATDAMGNAKNQTVTITITNVNEAPSISINGSGATHAITQAENSTSVVTYTASDPDAGASLSFSISGTDAADFAINSSSGALTFAASPDFEAPADSDVNNTYVVIITVSDGSLTDTQTLTITITNVNENSNIGAPTVSGTINKGVATTITVTSDVAGKVRFFVGGKRISNCLARSTTGSSPSFSATCSWKPPVTGRQSLTARITPTNSSFTTATSETTSIWVVRRSNPR